MKTIVTLAAAAAMLAAGAMTAAADQDAPRPATFGEQIEVPAAKVLSPKEMHRRGLSVNDTVNVTKAPQGPVDTSRS